MKKNEQAKYDMLKRVRDFGAAERERFPESSVGGQAFAAIARVVDEVDLHASEKMLAGKEGQRTRRVAREALKAAMFDIARTARAAALGAAGHENKLVMPRRTATEPLLTAARSFIDEGPSQIERFLPLGLAQTAFDELRALADTLEAVLEARAQGRTEVAHRQAAIRLGLAQGFQAVKTLDAVVANALKGEPALFAGWSRARRVLTSPEKSARVAVVPAGTGTSPAAPAHPSDPLRGAS